MDANERSNLRPTRRTTEARQARAGDEQRTEMIRDLESFLAWALDPPAVLRPRTGQALAGRERAASPAGRV